MQDFAIGLLAAGLPCYLFLWSITRSYERRERYQQAQIEALRERLRDASAVMGLAPSDHPVYRARFRVVEGDRG